MAVVVAESRYQAQDALELIDVDYEPLPVVVDPQKGAAKNAPQLHADIEGNQAFHWTVAGGDLDAAFAKADVVVKERIIQQRLIPTAMETRGAVAKWSSATGELTLWNTTQNPHIVRFLSSLVTGVPEDKLRVVAPEVGGGFGSKIAVIPGDFLTAFCAMKLGRPVKWTETRSENYQGTTHGRDHVQDVEIAATRDGKILGLRCTVWAGMGAYLSTAAPGIPTILHGLMLSGPYAIPAVKEDVYGIYTNTTPVEAYRGAGRPEATFMLERMLDKLSDELKIDPAEIRRRNLLPPFENGCNVVTGLTYDSGNYQATLDKALNHIEYEKLRAEQARQRKQPNGKYLGIGVCTYVEICGLGPSQVAGAIGFQGGLWESAIVRFHPSGKVNVFIGASPHGQGEETTFAQIVASELGVDVNDVKVDPRRHRQHADGMGNLRQPHDGGRRRGAGDRRAQDQGEGEAARRASHRSRARRHRIRRRQVLRQGRAGAIEDDSGHRADGQRRVEPSRRDGSRARGDELLRSAELRLSVRRARGGRRSRSRKPATSR